MTSKMHTPVVAPAIDVPRGTDIPQLIADVSAQLYSARICAAQSRYRSRLRPSDKYLTAAAEADALWEATVLRSRDALVELLDAYVIADHDLGF